MCYNTRQSRKKAELEKWLKVEAVIKDSQPELELIYYNASGWTHPVMWMVPQEHPNKLLPSMWGLMPSRQKQADYHDYFKNPKTFGGLNAKSEKLFDHFIYRYSWEKRRCIIPIDGFFEPHNTKVKVKGRDFKVPFYFHRKDGDPLYLGGIYTQTVDERWTFAVLTKPATPMFAKVHNDKKRRPVLIAEQNIDAWLHNGNTESDVQELIDDDLWEGELEAYPVTKDLYSRKVDSNYPEINEKVSYPEVSITF
jgi:putative SOS response-associated peptidase YedK